jgi:hypothetical protein
MGLFRSVSMRSIMEAPGDSPGLFPYNRVAVASFHGSKHHGRVGRSCDRHFHFFRSHDFSFALASSAWVTCHSRSSMAFNAALFAHSPQAPYSTPDQAQGRPRRRGLLNVLTQLSPWVFSLELQPPLVAFHSGCLDKLLAAAQGPQVNTLRDPLCDRHFRA